MKKSKILSTLVLASSALVLASCNGGETTKTVSGEYSYSAWGNTYGAALKVTFDTKTSKITKVERDTEVITAKNFVEVTPTVIEGSWDGTARNEEYARVIDAQLAEYVGKDVNELYNTIKANVSAAYTDTNHSNVTLSVTDSYKNDAAFVIMAGATQTAVRTSLAIANAIANIDSTDNLTPITTAEYTPVTNTVAGEYSYTAWGNHYGSAINVTYDVSNNKITKVERDTDVIASENIVEVTPTVIEGSWDGTARNEEYARVIDAQLAEYVGKDVYELYNTIKANVSATYTDADQSNVTLSVSDEYKNDEAFVIMAGATQTAVRTSLAIANAIANIDENDEYTPIVTATYVAPTPAE